MTVVAGGGGESALNRKHTWPMAVFLSMSISMCILVDILQHSAPLPFLPQELEQAGHDSYEIASVIGSYYWSGFLGGCILTSYQIHGLLFGENTVQSWALLRSHIIKLGVCLALGGATLLIEAEIHYYEQYATMHSLHLGCRLFQGFVGAFLFFYAFLLAVSAFEGRQQVFALTSTTIALNVAEVFGPFFGAWIFSVWGMNTTYYVLFFMSVVNNVLLVVVYFMMPTDEDMERKSLVDNPGGVVGASVRSQELSRTESDLRRTFEYRWARLMDVLTDKLLWRSLVVIAPAAMVKASFESILPLFADNHGYNEFEVGQLFTCIAIGFIIAAVGLGYVWENWKTRTKAIWVTVSLLLLGVIACVMLYSWGTSKSVAVRDWITYLNNGGSDETKDGAPRHHYLFLLCLGIYGVLLGITHTAAALYLSEVIDSMDYVKAKDSANGIWNTGWELGGSLGFVVAGAADTNSWHQEQRVLQWLGLVVIMAGAAFVLLYYSASRKRVESPKLH